jgi:hypothetical protein
MKRFRIGSLFTFLFAIQVAAQQAPQNPSPMVDTTRPHPRVAKGEVAGRRVELAAL